MTCLEHAIDDPQNSHRWVNFGDRQIEYLLPPSVDDWLPENQLARFIVEVVDKLDLSELTRMYGGCGSAAHHPVVLLALFIYGYATGRAVEPQDRARHLRLGRLPLCRRQRPSRPRHAGRIRGTLDPSGKARSGQKSFVRSIE
jgi:hypothetical protein